MWLLPLKQTIPLHVTVCRREETWQRRKLQPRKLLHQRRLLARKKLLVRRRLLARRRLQPRRSNSSFLLQLALRRSGIAKWRIVHKPLLASVSSGFFVAWDHRPVRFCPVPFAQASCPVPLAFFWGSSSDSTAQQQAAWHHLPPSARLSSPHPQIPKYARDNSPKLLFFACKRS